MSKKIILLLSLPLLACLFLLNCGKSADPVQTVVVYASEDQVFSEPVLKDFERETGIQVKVVYDTEETKGTGTMNRLIAEKDNPQADVYWANEPIRAEVLKQRGISTTYISPNSVGIPDHFKDAEGYWTGFSARARILVVNKDVADKPQSIKAYTDPRWKSRTVIANPLFGTTTTQVAALFTLWGEEATQIFLDEMKVNEVKLSTDNGESTDMVASGEFDFALVDSDDGFNRIAQGKAIVMVYPDQGENDAGCLIVPNAAVLIKGGPHPESGKKLIDYLLSSETEKKLAFADCAQIPLHAGVNIPEGIKPIEEIKAMNIDYAAVARKLQEIQPYLKSWVGY